MGKRSEFERVEKDFYRTPEKAVLPLLRHLAPGTVYAEPCAGDGALIDILARYGHRCIGAADIDPKRDDIPQGDALRMKVPAATQAIITNPPWTRTVMHPMIRHFARQRPTWTLFDSDWLFTGQAAEFMPILRKVVAVGRVRWIAGSTMDGKENAMWAMFDATRPRSTIEFYGREKGPTNGSD